MFAVNVLFPAITIILLKAYMHIKLGIIPHIINYL
jgi:hypothetical protein